MEVQTRVDVFEDIFLVFLALGALVGIVVIAYTLYNAYKYRDSGDRKDDEDLPTVGELPTGGTGGKKLFLSFGLSAIIVISLVVWTYGMLLYVEDGPDQDPEDGIEMEVEGWAFGWDFYYENGVETSGTGEGMVIPADTPVWIEVTSTDVWHAFGISDLRVKADAIPGEVDETWFIADEPAEYTAECYELCGFGHSGMNSPVEVLPQDQFDEWMDEQLTMEITLEDENGERVTDGFELELEHENNEEFEEDLQFTYSDDEFENGSITIDEMEQGGPYNVEITADDYEDVEESISFTGPVDETFELVDPDATDEEEDESNGDEETDATDEDEDESNGDGETDEEADSNGADEASDDGGDDE